MLWCSQLWFQKHTEVQRKYCPEDENWASAPVPCCAFAPDGVTRGQLLSLPNNTGSSRAGLASSPLKHTPHEAGCPSGGGPRRPNTWLSSSSGLNLLGLPQTPPNPGSITPVREERSCASPERGKRRRKPKGGARLCLRGSRSSADTPGLVKASGERHLSHTQAPRRADRGGREELVPAAPEPRSPARPTGSREGRQPCRPQASARLGGLHRFGGPGARRASPRIAALTERSESDPARDRLILSSECDGIAGPGPEGGAPGQTGSRVPERGPG